MFNNSETPPSQDPTKSPINFLVDKLYSSIESKKSYINSVKIELKLSEKNNSNIQVNRLKIIDILEEFEATVSESLQAIRTFKTEILNFQEKIQELERESQRKNHVKISSTEGTKLRTNRILDLKNNIDTDERYMTQQISHIQNESNVNDSLIDYSAHNTSIESRLNFDYTNLLNKLKNNSNSKSNDKNDRYISMNFNKSNKTSENYSAETSNKLPVENSANNINNTDNDKLRIIHNNINDNAALKTIQSNVNYDELIDAYYLNKKDRDNEREGDKQTNKQNKETTMNFSTNFNTLNNNNTIRNYKLNNIENSDEEEEKPCKLNVQPSGNLRTISNYSVFNTNENLSNNEKEEGEDGGKLTNTYHFQNPPLENLTPIQSKTNINESLNRGKTEDEYQNVDLFEESDYSILSKHDYNNSYNIDNMSQLIEKVMNNEGHKTYLVNKYGNGNVEEFKKNLRDKSLDLKSLKCDVKILNELRISNKNTHKNNSAQSKIPKQSIKLSKYSTFNTDTNNKASLINSDQYTGPLNFERTLRENYGKSLGKSKENSVSKRKKTTKIKVCGTGNRSNLDVTENSESVGRRNRAKTPSHPASVSFSCLRAKICGVKND